MEECQVCGFDWAYCGCAVCHSTALISASMKMYALCSKKTGGVTTCQEIHKQGYLEHGELYILKSNISFRFIVGGLPNPCWYPTQAKGPPIKRWYPIRRRYTASPQPACACTHRHRHTRTQRWEGESTLSTTQQRLSARCCEYQKNPATQNI